MKQLLFKFGMTVALSSAAATAFAEAAPVYEVDELDQDAVYSEHLPDILPPSPTMQHDSGAIIPGADHDAGPTGSVTASSMNIRQRMRRMEVQLNNLLESSSSAHMDSLQTQIQALRNEVEHLSHKLKKVEADQKASYTDIDNRLAELSAGSAATKPVVAKPSKPVKKKAKRVAKKQDDQNDGPDVAEEQQIYQTAYTLIKNKKYDEAVRTLQTMLKKYPSGQFASNAHYWLGELYGLLGNHKKSLGEFVTVVNNYRKSPRVSDAQLKIGLIFASQAKWSEAKSAFKKVVNKYPGTASARLASEQLKKIKKAGH